MRDCLRSVLSGGSDRHRGRMLNHLAGILLECETHEWSFSQLCTNLQRDHVLVDSAEFVPFHQLCRESHSEVLIRPDLLEAVYFCWLCQHTYLHSQHRLGYHLSPERQKGKEQVSSQTQRVLKAKAS